MPLEQPPFLRRLLDRFYLAAASLAALCILLIALLIVLQVVARWFGVIVPAAEEFAGFLMAGATFLALAWTLRSGGHIRVTLLIRTFSPRWRHAQEVVVLAIASALAIALAIFATALVIESREFGDVSAGHVAVPLWIPQLPLPLGLAMLAVALLDELVGILTGSTPSQTDDEGDTL